MAFDQQVGLEALEPADHLVREALHLGEAARDRCGFFAEAVAKRTADGVRKDDLELVRRLRERFHLQACAVECGGDLGRQGVAVIEHQKRR